LAELQGAVGDLKAAARLEPRSKEIRDQLAAAQGALAEEKARDKAAVAKMLDGNAGAYTDAHAEAAARALQTEAQEAERQRALGPGAATPESTRVEMANEATIADARLESNQGNLVQDMTTGKIKYMSMEEMGGSTEAYVWGQNTTQISLRFPRLPSATLAKDVQVRCTSSAVRVCVGEATLIDGGLYGKVLADELVYELEDVVSGKGKSGGAGLGQIDSKQLVVTLAKAHPTKADQHWRCVVHDEAVIDTTRFGSPVISFNEDDEKDVAAYLRYHAKLRCVGSPLMPGAE